MESTITNNSDELTKLTSGLNQLDKDKRGLSIIRIEVTVHLQSDQK